MSETAQESPSPQKVQIIATAAAITDVVAFAFVGTVVFDAPLLGAGAGVLFGILSYFFLTYALTQGEASDASEPTA